MHASIVPAFIEANGEQAYTRFHGKNRENWFKRNVTAAERFKYLYSERELGSLAEGLGTLEKKGSNAHSPSSITAIRILAS